jgi:hypothetical protein
MRSWGLEGGPIAGRLAWVLVLVALVLGATLFFACAQEQQQQPGFDAGNMDGTLDAGSEMSLVANDGATEAEAAGTCPNNACAVNHADCNHDASDGCEANLKTSVTNCGGCGKVCSDAGVDGGDSGLPFDAVPFCTDGGCDWFCAPIPNVGEIYKRCNDTCVYFVCDQMNCGDCNVVCPKDSLGNGVCNAGTCGCPFGTVDCDGVNECGLECKDLNHDGNNCGKCGRQCPQDPNLDPFHMTYTCNGPAPDGGLPPCAKVCIQKIGEVWLDCNGDSQQAPDAGDGCETFGWGSTTNCGACGKACKNGDVCHPVNTTSIDQECGCPSPLSYCPSAPWCRNFQNDPLNCGACGHVCFTPPNAKAACVNGKCGYECDVGFADCNHKSGDGCEIDILDNPDNCGGCVAGCDGGDCGQQCAKNDQGDYIQRCQNGVCATQGCGNK